MNEIPSFVEAEFRGETHQSAKNGRHKIGDASPLLVYY